MTAAGADGIGRAELNGMGPPTGYTQSVCKCARFFAVREMEIVKVMTQTSCVKYFLTYFFFSFFYSQGHVSRFKL